MITRRLQSYSLRETPQYIYNATSDKPSGKRYLHIFPFLFDNYASLALSHSMTSSLSPTSSSTPVLAISSASSDQSDAAK